MNSLYDLATPTPDGYRDLSVEALATVTAKLRLVDVREPDEFVGELGHVDGAELVPLATVGAVAQGWPRDQTLVMICRSGGRSGRAARELVGLGFTTVMNLKGGMLAWNAASLPVVRR
jgi:rhodanese-related sulfurtransferase